MDRFCAIILFAAACGDNLTPAPGQHDPIGGETDPGGQLTPQPLTVPEVCGVVGWTSVIANRSNAMNVSVAVNASSDVTLLSVPEAGGAILGFNISQRMTVMGDPEGTKLAINDVFTAVSASMIGDRIVATGVDATSVQVDLVDGNLGNPITIAKLPGSVVAKPALYPLGSSAIIPYAGATGLSLATFDGSWQRIGDDLVGGTNEPVVALAANQYGDTLLTAYTTADSCYTELLATGKPGNSYQVGFACNAPRIASNYLTGSAKLVYETAGGVSLASLVNTEMSGDIETVRDVAHAPRIVFDGSRYWISYLDVRGDVIVGFLDGNNHLVSTSIPDTRPQGDAYEMTLIEGTPWVFTLDDTGYQAHRMCRDAVW